jgi:hypothetical protein
MAVAQNEKYITDDNRFNRSPTCLSAFAEEELLNRLWGCEVAAKGQHCADIGETDAYSSHQITVSCTSRISFLLADLDSEDHEDLVQCRN